jgi:hypothetical protein
MPEPFQTRTDVLGGHKTYRTPRYAVAAGSDTSCLVPHASCRKRAAVNLIRQIFRDACALFAHPVNEQTAFKIEIFTFENTYFRNCRMKNITGYLEKEQVDEMLRPRAAAVNVTTC